MVLLHILLEHLKPMSFRLMHSGSDHSMAILERQISRLYVISEQDFEYSNFLGIQHPVAIFLL